MDILLKKVTLIDPSSSFNLKKCDLLIKDGVIEAIESNIEASEVPVFQEDHAHVSLGWIDVGVLGGDPGFEHREDLSSLVNAAQTGGFTHIATYPNTSPVVDTKSEVIYQIRNNPYQTVTVLPIGAVTKSCEGKDITEMMDMHHAGAIAFSDGILPIQNGGVVMRALQYLKGFGGLLMNYPLDQSIAQNGQIHEGAVSTSLGMPGFPALSEELMVQRDLFLAAYADTKIHLSNISSAGAVQMVREAKKEGIKVTASVAVINLYHLVDQLVTFDTNFKVLPPLREASDQEALKAGLSDGTIDFISSNHIPLEGELKLLEFPYADFGVTGLESCFAVSRKALAEQMDLGTLINCWSYRPRQIFQLPQQIKVGEQADLTLFQPDQLWTFGEQHQASKSKNNPFINTELMGRVLGIINNNQSTIPMLQ